MNSLTHSKQRRAPSTANNVTKKIAISTEVVPVRLLALAILHEARVALPAQLLREAVRTRYEREVTPSQLTATLKNERRSFGKSKRVDYLAPAIDGDGYAVRGWYTSTAWSLYARVLTSSAHGEAASRALAAIVGKTPANFSPIVEQEVTKAVERLTHLTMRESFFGIRETP